MSRFLSQQFRGKEGYKLGERPKAVDFIKLNANESPFPPSPKVMEAVASADLEQMRLYADPHNSAFRQSIAESLGVSVDQVLADGGSDVILGYCLLAYGLDEPGFLFPDITYGFYRVFSLTYGVSFREIPLNDDFTINLEDYRGCGRHILIANPNAPTGLVLSRDQIETILRGNPDSVVIVDEAYVDFGNESCVPLTAKYPNLIVIQTLSKSRSLAGARLGFAVSSPEIIDDLEALRSSFNPDSISTVSQIMGCAAMKDEAYTRACTGKTIALRDSVAEEFARRGFTVTDSHTNFLFVSPPGISAAAYTRALKERRILARYYDGPRVRDYVRVTVGTESQMAELIRQTDEILADYERSLARESCDSALV